jgi:hypothetical protein
MRRQKIAEPDAAEMIVKEEIHKHGYHREA